MHMDSANRHFLVFSTMFANKKLGRIAKFQRFSTNKLREFDIYATDAPDKIDKTKTRSVE